MVQNALKLTRFNVMFPHFLASILQTYTEKDYSVSRQTMPKPHRETTTVNPQVANCEPLAMPVKLTDGSWHIEMSLSSVALKAASIIVRWTVTLKCYWPPRSTDAAAACTVSRWPFSTPVSSARAYLRCADCQKLIPNQSAILLTALQAGFIITAVTQLLDKNHCFTNTSCN